MNDAEGDHRGGISTFENVTYAHMCVNGNTVHTYEDPVNNQFCFLGVYIYKKIPKVNTQYQASKNLGKRIKKFEIRMKKF